ncbi:toxin Doc [Embleya sp. AB8]|uniref:toxin Doc n=1 Tax=Embleya sp. AB8 TaxID=3156304 RepID=UPI003C758E01
MIVRIDERWLLEIQERYVPEESRLRDFTALKAVVARQLADGPHVGYTIDAAWIAAAVGHTIVKLRPMESRNGLFAACAVFSCMAAAGSAIDPKYGDLNGLVRDVDNGAADVFEMAGRIRSWIV